MNNKVIKLCDQDDYLKELKLIKEKLENFDKELFSSVIKLAILKEWKVWSEEQKAGTEFNFNEEMFENCQDQNITKLLNLRAKLDSTINELT